MIAPRSQIRKLLDTPAGASGLAKTEVFDATGEVPYTATAMKTVSRRTRKTNTLRDARTLQRTINRLRGHALVPRGVYRFTSHKDSQQWMIRTMARTHARQKLKIS